MSEKLCLQWNDFKENVNSAFGRLREDKEFTDVTLVSEDGQQMEAHRVILASPNPLFQVLLSWNNHAHPLIYLRGMIFHDLARFALKTTWFEHQHTSLARASLNMGNITNN